MQALTLTAPWGQLCVARPWSPEQQYADGRYAIKPIETRTWQLSYVRLPLRIAIHTAKGIDRQLRDTITEYDPDYAGGEQRVFTQPYRSALHLAGYSAHDPWQKGYGVGNLDEDPEGAPYQFLTLGTIVGLATIETIVPTDAITRLWQRGKIHDRIYQLGNFAAGRYAWQLIDPVEIAPIPCAGAQGLWTVPGHIAAEIIEKDDPAAYRSFAAPSAVRRS